MRLGDLLDEAGIIPDLKASSKKALLEELAEVATRRFPSIDKEKLLAVLAEREQLGTTGIGDGVAIPHGKLTGLVQPILCFGRSKKGIGFEALDGQPAFLFFLLVAPETSAGIHLQALARIARLLKNSHFRKRLLEAKGRKDIYETIVRADEEN